MKQSRIEREAATWLIELDTAAEPEALWPKFEEWLKQGPEYEAAFKSMEEAWKAVEDLQVFHINHSGQLPNPMFTPKRRPSLLEVVRSPGALAIAATFLIALLGGWIYQAFRAGQWTPVAGASWQTYATAYGGRERVLLADGSLMDLNTNTLVRVNRASEGREIEIIRGEALFDAKRNPSHPFRVHAGDANVEVLGTTFSVWRKTDSEFVTLVKDGSVRVTQALSGSTMALANQIATASAGGVKVDQLDAEKVNRMLSWEEGELHFQGETLKEVVEAFNRYNPTKLQIDDESIERQRIGGRFVATDPMGFADLLEHTFGIHHVLETVKNTRTQVIHLSRAKL